MRQAGGFFLLSFRGVKKLRFNSCDAGLTRDLLPGFFVIRFFKVFAAGIFCKKLTFINIQSLNWIGDFFVKSKVLTGSTPN